MGIPILYIQESEMNWEIRYAWDTVLSRLQEVSAPTVTSPSTGKSAHSIFWGGDFEQQHGIAAVTEMHHGTGQAAWYSGTVYTALTAENCKAPLMYHTLSRYTPCTAGMAEQGTEEHQPCIADE